MFCRWSPTRRVQNSVLWVTQGVGRSLNIYSVSICLSHIGSMQYGIRKKPAFIEMRRWTGRVSSLSLTSPIYDHRQMMSNLAFHHPRCLFVMSQLTDQNDSSIYYYPSSPSEGTNLTNGYITSPSHLLKLHTCLCLLAYYLDQLKI